MVEILFLKSKFIGISAQEEGVNLKDFRVFFRKKVSDKREFLDLTQLIRPFQKKCFVFCQITPLYENTHAFGVIVVLPLLGVEIRAIC